MTSEISSFFQIISVHLSLPLFSFTQWKDKCASYSFTTKNLTHSMCQVSLVVKYSLLLLEITINHNYKMWYPSKPVIIIASKTRNAKRCERRELLR